MLQRIDSQHGASLEGTEMWHQAGYPWTIVCMAQWVRSQLSAAHHKATLFLCTAKDYIQNVEPGVLLRARNQLIKFPNMIQTGRLPGIAAMHLHMNMRLTVTICPRLAPVDTTGTIVNIELEAPDHVRLEQGGAPRMLLLHPQPVALVRLDDAAEDTGLGEGIIAVTPTQAPEPFYLNIRDPHKSKDIKVKATRVQIPLAIENASTFTYYKAALPILG